MNKTPFCNMCFNAGKPASEHKSHWLRDKSGAVVCPYLLSMECSYCHEKGHTKSHCPILRNRRWHLREKYDVSGLPPMPERLMPLVVPKRCIPVAAAVAVAVVAHCDSSDDECSVLSGGGKSIKMMMNWADMCDSDVEDDEF